jgi:hypothetical protein
MGEVTTEAFLPRGVAEAEMGVVDDLLEEEAEADATILAVEEGAEVVADAMSAARKTTGEMSAPIARTRLKPTKSRLQSKRRRNPQAIVRKRVIRKKTNPVT